MINKEKYDWSNVDWNMSGSAIARQLGCSKEAARLARQRRDLPPSTYRYRPPAGPKPSTLNAFPRARRLIQAGYSGPATAKICGLSAEIIYIYSKKGLLPKLKNTMHRPINWELNDMMIAKIWRVVHPGQVRHCCQYKKAKWDGRNPHRWKDPEYISTIAIERKKAKKWFAQQNRIKKLRKQLQVKT